MYLGIKKHLIFLTQNMQFLVNLSSQNKLCERIQEQPMCLNDFIDPLYSDYEKLIVNKQFNWWLLRNNKILMHKTYFYLYFHNKLNNT